MKRRGFLASLLGLAAAPVAAKLPASPTRWRIRERFITQSVVLNPECMVRAEEASLPNPIICGINGRIYLIRPFL